MIRNLILLLFCVMAVKGVAVIIYTAVNVQGALAECIQLDPKLTILTNGTDSKDAQCFLDCMYKKAGLIDEAGHTNETVVDTFIGKESSYGWLKTVVHKCTSSVVNEDEPCKTAANLANCEVDEEIKLVSSLVVQTPASGDAK
ncbi:hypothetical protein PPYR_02453 [Photinus pyralis]|uniref:Uncharacterized protein n=1 Tax=Photinus pyralis TaxID=7054 RepID=A0A1Y1L380_PHOPY|nr:uncharacterized protein LOC116158583 [Photinus pyralis]KAB0805483.1 hypothetical protein PPYR_02453 [Photinus pyralis]